MSVFRLPLLIASLFSILFLIGVEKVCAQAPGDQDKKEFKGTILNAHVGTFLPNQIEGIDEMLPMWGAKYGFSSRKGMIEIGALSAQAYGTTFYNASLSFRGTIPLEAGISGIMFVGADANYYQPVNGTFKTTGGGHVGGGFVALVGDQLWFRTDMKFHVNPGTSLYFGFGFEVQMPSGSDKEGASAESGEPPK